ncbi:MAG: nickel pincer cofactor biosynthesis protein LarB [Desulfobacterales bacterium]|nr:nickel pincer cofactor biosynthesis protein LarB [Desulfobacterales bacterium]
MWDRHKMRGLLQQVAEGKRPVEDALADICALNTENLDFARLDHHRGLRQGFAEVVYCAGKTPEQVGRIFSHLAQRHDKVLGTRATQEHYLAAKDKVSGSELHYHEIAKTLWINRQPSARKSGVVVLAAGTADLPVAEEAAITLELMGNEAERIYDIGVSGLHRLLDVLPAIQKANVLVAVAGMEGALPSVVGGLVSIPVIAVPTSVGYGTGVGGLAAMLGMLNSCASGLAVVNIDNGFGAGCIAARINAMALVKTVGQSDGKNPMARSVERKTLRKAQAEQGDGISGFRGLN